MIQITALCPQQFVGVNTVFEQLARLLYNEPDIAFKRVALETWAEEVQPFHTDILLLGGWVPATYPVILRQHKNDSMCQPIVTAALNCSTYGQMDLSQQEYLFLQEGYGEMQEKSLDLILFGYEEVAIGERIRHPQLKELERLRHFPYPFDAEGFRFVPGKDKRKKVTFLVPQHPRKNILNQLKAFELLRQDSSISLVTNVPMENPPSYIRARNWLSPEDYLDEISFSTLGLHVTFVESLAYAVLEYLACGTPVLVSPVIANNLKMHPLLGELVVANPDSIQAIQKAMKWILDLSEHGYAELCQRCRDHALKLSEEFNANCLKAIRELCLLVK